MSRSLKSFDEKPVHNTHVYTNTINLEAAVRKVLQDIVQRDHWLITDAQRLMSVRLIDVRVLGASESFHVTLELDTRERTTWPQRFTDGDAGFWPNLGH